MTRLDALNRTALTVVAVVLAAAGAYGLLRGAEAFGTDRYEIVAGPRIEPHSIVAGAIRLRFQHGAIWSASDRYGRADHRAARVVGDTPAHYVGLGFLCGGTGRSDPRTHGDRGTGREATKTGSNGEGAIEIHLS